MAITQYILDNLLYLIQDSEAGAFTFFKHSLTYFYSSDYTLLFTLKVTLCLSMLILIRGGVPRYRYDFLTKIGWVKFLGYILAVFLMSLILFLFW